MQRTENQRQILKAIADLKNVQFGKATNHLRRNGLPRQRNPHAITGTSVFMDDYVDFVRYQYVGAQRQQAKHHPLLERPAVREQGSNKRRRDDANKEAARSRKRPRRLHDAVSISVSTLCPSNQRRLIGLWKGWRRIPWAISTDEEEAFFFDA